MQLTTVALRNLAGSQLKEWNMVMAGALIAALPMLFIYIIMGRFIRGLLAGSVKGSHVKWVSGLRIARYSAA